MKVYAVIDTNVLVSALLAKRPDSAPVQILDRLFSRDFIPMYNEEIVAEYNEVLRILRGAPFPQALVQRFNAVSSSILPQFRTSAPFRLSFLSRGDRGKQNTTL